jgi:hypothetical protein
VLFDEYHVENPPVTPKGVSFPAECSNGAMTPQEKLLEFTLFDLTGSGGTPTLLPSAGDFGSQSVHFTTAAKTFTWTNNSIFPASVTSMAASGDFHIVSNTCSGAIPASSGCTLNVVFTPSALGAETGMLTVVSSASTLTSTLTGTGTPDLTSGAGAAPLSFGNVDVSATSAAQTVVWTNTAGGAVTVPPFRISGDFAIAGSSCGATLAAGASCSIAVTFKPTTAGSRSGVFTTSSADPAYAGLQTALTGNGVDFSIAISPDSGSVVAGRGVSPTLTLTPSTGFNAAVTLSCAAAAAASTCSTPATSLVLSAATKQPLAIDTISRYNVVGYGGIGGGIGGGRLGLLWLLAMGSGLLLGRRSAHALLRAGLFALLLAAGGLSLSGCSGRLPDANSPYTPPGTYSYLVTASDGTLTHTATYTLTVTVR